jgi:hypothetical protein
VNGTTIIRRPPIYILSCVKDPSLSNIRNFLNNDSQSDYCVQCHSGTIRNFIECKTISLNFTVHNNIDSILAHLLPFLNQCWIGKYGNTIDKDHYQNEELFAGVTSYFEYMKCFFSF